MLADFEARSLRSLFADEAQFLPHIFARLKSLLEVPFCGARLLPHGRSHVRGDQYGRLQEPPPFEEFERFNEQSLRTASDSSRRSSEGLEQISRAEMLLPIEAELMSCDSANLSSRRQIRLPSQTRSRSAAFSMAGAANNIVAAARRGAEMGRTLDGWDKFLHTSSRRRSRRD